GSDVGIKLEPVTVSVSDAPPAVAAFGEIVLTAGTGLAAGFTRKVRVLERPFCPAPEKGLSVLTKFVPALAIRSAEIVAVTVVGLTTVVGMVLPSHCTTVLATNPWVGLVTVRVNAAPPALACDGARKEIAAPVGTWKVLP